MSRTFGFVFTAGASLVSLGCGGTLADTADSAPIDAAKDLAAVDDAATSVADAQSDALIACATGYDCTSLFFSEPSPPSSVPCCADKVCRFEPYDDCTDANAQLIEAANYDQSCTADTDCIAVAEGNFCDPGAGNCPNAAISKSANAHYQADTAKTRAASCYAPGDCADLGGPCCIGGTCQFGGQCPFTMFLTCALGAACSPMQTCTGGIAGCSSTCQPQCLNGTWQSPCPIDLPESPSACAAEGAECGYMTSTNICGAANCDCQDGRWNCEPTCSIPIQFATDGGRADATDGGPADAAAE